MDKIKNMHSLMTIFQFDADVDSFSIKVAACSKLPRPDIGVKRHIQGRKNMTRVGLNPNLAMKTNISGDGINF